MQSIDKREPAFFADFVRRENPTDWRDLSQAIGVACRTYMLSGQLPDGSSVVPSEQNFQCAYTGIRVEVENSHIDHFRKQSLFPTLRFDWSNLFVSTNAKNYGATPKDKAIRNASDNDLLIHPAVENPAAFFYHTFTGEIFPLSSDPSSRDFQRASFTIAAFQLNDPALVNRRLAAIKNMQAYSEQLPAAEVFELIGEFEACLGELWENVAF